MALAAGHACRPELEERALAKLKALEELGRAAAADPKPPFVHYNLGVIYRRKGDFESAKKEFLADAAVEPRWPTITINSGPSARR